MANSPLAIVMVGLPATGKTYIARNLARYLRWSAIPTRTVSVAHLRRTTVGARLRADFFDPENEDALGERTKIADVALEMLLEWFGRGGGVVGILDASNTTLQRRRVIRRAIEERGVGVVFLECIYGLEGTGESVESHIRELRMVCPEYGDMSAEEAVSDFKRRIEYYRPDYVSLGGACGEAHVSYIQMHNGGERIVVNSLAGYLATRVLYFLMNLRLGSRTIYLCPQAESGHLNVRRADEGLTEEGRLFGRHLHETMRLVRRDNPPRLRVWTSVRLRAVETARFFDQTQVSQKQQLNELDPGLTDGLDEAEIRARFPEDYQLHQKDPYRHRYPRAESFRDLANRLEAIILQLEKESDDVLVIAHVSVIRCLYAYYAETDPGEIPSLPIGSDEIVEISPKAYGVKESRYNVFSGEPVFLGMFRFYRDALQL